MSNKALILASGSPRRVELLGQIGLPFTVQAPAIDETPRAAETAAVYVERMAREKAHALSVADAVVLAADTVVVLDGRILGKPADAEDAVATLRALGGRRHEVLTAIALCDGETLHSEVVSTAVTFVPIDEDLARAYVATGESADKAGSYGIQGIGGILAERIEGSYSAVVGLPLAETERALIRFGVDGWRHRGKR